MPRPKPGPVKKDSLAEFLRMPQRFAARTSLYFQQLGDLAAQGSVDPRDFIERSLQLWSGAFDDLADCLNPESQSEFGRLFQVPVIRPRVPIIKDVMRRERGDIGLNLPAEIFDTYGDNEVISLSINGLVRRPNSKRDLRPALTLASEQNVRVSPERITRATRNQAELKVFGLTPAVSSKDTFEGVVWGVAKSAPKVRFPVAVVVITIA